jgi:TRAP-type C4-dicarboxylate transport system permease small subunit
MILNRLEQFSRKVCNVLAVISGVALTLMMLLACANMFFRAVWVPVQGTFELMGYLGAVVASFALGISQINKSHISVGLFFNSFPPLLRKILDFLTLLVSCLFFLLCAREVFNWGSFVLDIGELSETLGIVYYPFVFAVAFGYLCIAFVLFMEMLRVFFEPQKTKRA